MKIDANLINKAWVYMMFEEPETMDFRLDMYMLIKDQLAQERMLNENWTNLFS